MYMYAMNSNNVLYNRTIIELYLYLYKYVCNMYLYVFFILY